MTENNVESPIHSPNSVKIKVKCGSCIYLTRSAIYSDGEHLRSCSKLGVQPHSNPCEKYSPDPYSVSFKERPKAIRLLRDLILEVENDRELDIFATFILRERTTRKYGLHFGQTVYLKAFASDYLSNWFKVSIVYADSQYVYAQGANGSRWMVHHDSIMMPEKWENIRSDLKKRRRIVDKDWAKVTALDRPDVDELKDEKYIPDWLPAMLEIDSNIGKKQKSGVTFTITNNKSKGKVKHQKGKISARNVRSSGK